MEAYYTVKDITDLYGRQRTAIMRVAENLDIGEIKKVPGGKGRLNHQLVFTEAEKEKLAEFWNEN